MKLTTPFLYSNLFNTSTCLINQLFGENRNAVLCDVNGNCSVSYGPAGHTGIDFETVSGWEYDRVGEWKFDHGKYVKGTWQRRPADYKEGRRRLIACHDGTLSAVYNANKQKDGWGFYITAEPEEENGKTVQYRTLYWHIETIWGSIKNWTGEIMNGRKTMKVRRGAIVGIAGNNGMSTGPHLHLELQRRVKTNGVWSAWERLDPITYFDDEQVVYQRYSYIGEGQWFYKGKSITRKEVDALIKTFPKVIL